MAQTNTSESEFSRIRGRNFQGFIDFTEDFLRLSLTEFQRGGTFCCDITNAILEKDPRQFFIFRHIDDLFIELITNTQLEIMDNSGKNMLIVPVDITYKGRTLRFNLEIEVFEPIFSNQAEKSEWFYKQISQMHRFYSKLQAEKVNWAQERTQFQRQLFNYHHFKLDSSIISAPQLIKFKKDTTNPRSTYFQVDKDKVRVVGTGQYAPYNHCEVLPKVGIYYYKFKILRTGAKQILAGICGKNIKSEAAANLLTNPYIMAFNFKNSHYHSKAAALNLSSSVQFGQISETTVLKVEINLNANHLTWFVNDQPVYLTQIPKQFDDVYIHPCLIMQATGDTIEFVNK